MDLLGRASHRGGHRHALPRALPCGQVLSRHWWALFKAGLDSERVGVLGSCEVAIISRARSEEHAIGDNGARIKHNDHLLSTLKVALRSLSNWRGCAYFVDS